ncbi:MAG: flavin reductase family protein [Planctomycetota bacterium]
MASTTDLPEFARALGRIPSGLFVVTTLDGERPLGFVASLVQQFGFEPPTVAVAVGQDRDHLAAMRASGRFAVSVVDDASKQVMAPFFGKVPEGQTPFDVVAHRAGSNRCPVLEEALAWFECEVSGEHETGDHVVVFGRVTDGRLAREGDPKVHLRKNGLSY